MGIALFRRQDPAIRGTPRIPAAVFPVLQFPSQSRYRGLCQFPAARMPKHRPQAVYMGHAAGDPGLSGTVLPRRPVVSEIIGSALRRRKLMAKRQQCLCILLQKCFILLGIYLVFPVFYHLLTSLSPAAHRISYTLRRRISSRLPDITVTLRLPGSMSKKLSERIRSSCALRISTPFA